MRLDLTPENVLVFTLSRRNVLTLLSTLHGGPGATRAIFSGNVYFLGRPESGLMFAVRAQADEEHYDRPEGPPGEMSPESEAYIRWAEARWDKDEEPLPRDELDAGDAAA